VGRRQEGSLVMLLLGMLVLGLATFAAMLAFITFCERV
jgi:sulfite exporter TauE/SafE